MSVMICCEHYIARSDCHSAISKEINGRGEVRIYSLHDKEGVREWKILISMKCMFKTFQLHNNKESI